jgi:hypothetical protein
LTREFYCPYHVVAYFPSESIIRRGISNAEVVDRNSNDIGNSDLDFLYGGIPSGGVTAKCLAGQGVSAGLFPDHI